MNSLNGPSINLMRQLAPDGCDSETATRAIALCCLAAAGLAARHNDQVDLGALLPDDLREQWGRICSVLIDLAHWATPAAGPADLPGPDPLHLLALVLGREENRER